MLGGTQTSPHLWTSSSLRGPLWQRSHCSFLTGAGAAPGAHLGAPVHMGPQQGGVAEETAPSRTRGQGRPPGGAQGPGGMPWGLPSDLRRQTPGRVLCSGLCGGTSQALSRCSQGPVLRGLQLPARSRRENERRDPCLHVHITEEKLTEREACPPRVRELTRKGDSSSDSLTPSMVGVFIKSLTAPRPPFPHLFDEDTRRGRPLGYFSFHTAQWERVTLLTTVSIISHLRFELPMST